MLASRHVQVQVYIAIANAVDDVSNDTMDKEKR